MWEVIIWFDDQIELMGHARKAVGSHRYMQRLEEEGQLELQLAGPIADLEPDPLSKNIDAKERNPLRRPGGLPAGPGG